jgi:N-acetyl-anhydromuramyl-L-alanine amidase AmpD
MLRKVFLVFVLTGLCWARPPLWDEPTPGTAVLKGENGGVVWVDDDFPDHFLNWGYQEPEWLEWFLSYQNWTREYRRYFHRHYAENSLFFTPCMIVMHYTVVPTAEQTYSVLQRRHVSVHFLIAKDGTIYQLMPLNRRCNGAYGVNHRALSIELVASTESDLLSRPYQVFQSFCLARYLMQRYDIKLDKVVGHYEVGQGVTRVPEYLDLFDPYYPTRYPPSDMRYDPGETYMRWLRSYLRVNPP